MIVNYELVPVLNNINFSNRFIELSDKYKDFENRLMDEDFENVQNVILSFEYNFRFSKSENFFKLIENVSFYRIQFNVSTLRGIVEFVWGVEKNGERLKMGGSICGAVEFLTNQEFTSKPVYRSYEDLKVILKEALIIYEDFKAELIKQDAAENIS